MKPVVNYISVCSGIEAASVAMSRIPDVDWHPVAFSEIDPFACSVLAYHFPAVPNLGDLSKIRYDKDNDELTNGTDHVRLHGRRIHAILGGTPCQDLSVAGKRAGAGRGSGTRSALFYEYARLVDEVHPDWILFENVPGMLSSNSGRDFYYMQSALVDCGYGIAWRVLDSQYTVVGGPMPNGTWGGYTRGIPQRRKRVWLVGCLGGDDHAAAQILFEPARLLGDHPPVREPGKGAAGPSGYRVAGDDRLVGLAKSCGNGQLNQLEPEEVAKTLDTMHDAQAVCIGKEAYNIGEAGQGSLDSRVREIDVSDTRNRKDGTGGNNLPLVVYSKASHARNKDGDGERYEASEVAQTRNTFDNGESRAQEVVVALEGNGARPSHKGAGFATDDASFTLNTIEQHAVAVGFSHSNSDISIQTKPTPECSMTLRSVPTGEGAAVISVDRLNQSVAEDVMHTIKANAATGDGIPTVIGINSPQPHSTTRGFGEDVQPTFGAAAGESGNNKPMVAVAIGFKAGQSAGGGLGDEREVAPTLAAQPSALEPTVAVGCDRRNQSGSTEVQPAIQSTVSDGGSTVALGFGETGQGFWQPGTQCLRAEGENRPSRPGNVAVVGVDTFNQSLTGDVSKTLNSAATDTDHIPVVLHHIVRRLTVIECSRLQGFPDLWLKFPTGTMRKIDKEEYDYLYGIPELRKYLRTPANSLRGCYETELPSDSAAYRALGNSWATNCAEWILRRIVAAMRLGII